MRTIQEYVDTLPPVRACVHIYVFRKDTRYMYPSDIKHFSTIDSARAFIIDELRIQSPFEHGDWYIRFTERYRKPYPTWAHKRLQMYLFHGVPTYNEHLGIMIIGTTLHKIFHGDFPSQVYTYPTPEEK